VSRSTRSRCWAGSSRSSTHGGGAPQLFLSRAFHRGRSRGGALGPSSSRDGGTGDGRGRSREGRGVSGTSVGGTSVGAGVVVSGAPADRAWRGVGSGKVPGAAARRTQRCARQSCPGSQSMWAVHAPSRGRRRWQAPTNSAVTAAKSRTNPIRRTVPLQHGAGPVIQWSIANPRPVSASSQVVRWRTVQARQVELEGRSLAWAAGDLQRTAVGGDDLPPDVKAQP
jgi:hypothetical protein